MVPKDVSSKVNQLRALKLSSTLPEDLNKVRVALHIRTVRTNSKYDQDCFDGMCCVMVKPDHIHSTIMHF